MYVIHLHYLYYSDAAVRLWFFSEKHYVLKKKKIILSLLIH